MADTITGIEGNECKWASFNKPARNVELLTSVSAAMRSQSLYSEPFELSDAAILDGLHAAQDDIAASIQLIEKKLGRKAA